MTNHSSIESLRSATVYGSDGEKIGRVGEVYLDDQTDQPTFATVHTGLFGTKQTFVPLDRAQTTDEGLTVPFDKDFIKGAPTIDDDGSLSPEEEQRLYEYYSMDSGTRRDDAGADRDVRTSGRHHDGTAGAGVAGTATDDRAAAAHDGHTPAEERAAEQRGTAVQGGTDGVAAGTRGADAAGTQDVVAHEERLRATGHSERRETGRARLRKHVVTETETVEVPVRREELHIQRESIDSDSPEARAGAQDAFTGDGEETVVTTYEERPVVSTETVATERVSLNKEATESTERVSGEVRKEEIEVDEDGRPRR